LVIAVTAVMKQEYGLEDPYLGSETYLKRPGVVVNIDP
jgi:hypothetical protein